MIKREDLIKKFNMGMGVLSCHIELNSICNLQDINIVAESFVGDLFRILYGWDLRNANSSFSNNSGYDLISEKDRIIIQVTATDSSEKVKHTLQTLKNVIHEKPDLSGYTLYFMILKIQSKRALKYKGKENKGYICPEGIIFNQKENIYDFSTFVKKVDSLSEVTDAMKINLLRTFMNKNRNLFGAGELMLSARNNIDSIIKEYADNFSAKLFRHIHKEANVTLKGVFVQPKIERMNEPPQKLVSILGGFLWDEREIRILFIEGDAACGKSSFISYLCYHYRLADKIGRGIFLQGNLICIKLRDLELDEKDSKLEDCIRKYLGFSEHSNYNAYKAELDNYVIILDGADELSMLEGNGKRSLENILIFVRKIFKKNKIIVTTRPQYIDYEKLGADFKFQIVRMQHFDKEMRKEWIIKYEKCGEQMLPETKNYILNLDEKKAVGVADTPLALYLIAACEMREELRENIWALYHEIFTNAIIETPYDENFSGFLKHPIREKKTLLLEIVGRIAFELFRKSEKEQYYISAEDLDLIINEFDLESPYSEWVCKCCVLCAYWKSNDEKGALEFYHNNIRDYFFCEYIYDRIYNILLLDDLEESIQAFLNCMCEIMSYGEISESTWEETFLFLHEKIRYESKKFIHEYEKMQLGKRLASIFSRTLCEDIIWKYSYGENNYQKIKYTVSNTLMLLRVWQNGLGINRRGWKNTFAENTIDLKNIAKSNILSDWEWIFRRTIYVPPYDRSISIGQHSIFKNISFEKRYMEEENFEASIFEKVSFEHSYLKDTDLKACRFEDEISFAGAILIGVEFSDAVLINVNFTGATLQKCFFRGTKIISGNFNGCIIGNCLFSETVMENVDWSCAKTGRFDFDTVTCKNCCLDNINMEERQIVESTFIECVIKSGDFKNTFIEELHVQGGDFAKSSFAGATLMGNKWENVNFAEVDFDNTIICESDFRQLEYAGAVLRDIKTKKESWREIN